MGSDAPITWPPLIPPPPITIDQHCGQWSRPPAGLILGVRPNSPIATTIVLSYMPRSFSSSTSELYPLSNHGPQSVRYASIGVNGDEPCISQVISLKTVSN